MIKLNDEFAKSVAPTIYFVWGQIAPDAMEFCTDNEQALEMCLDADRILQFCEPYSAGKKTVEEGIKAHADLKAAFAEHGFNKVLKFLNKHVNGLV